MAFQFPWTNLHELNLDWFLSKFKQFTDNFLQTTATAESVPYNAQPSVTVTGGELDDDTDIVNPFNFHFKIPAGMGILSLTITYNVTDDDTQPTTGWTTTKPAVNPGQYLWIKQTIIMQNGVGQSYTYFVYYPVDASITNIDAYPTENSPNAVSSGGVYTVQTRQDENIAYVEESTTASKSYNNGEYFINSTGVLCEITADVTSGSTLTQGTNYKVLGGAGGLASNLTGLSEDYKYHRYIPSSGTKQWYIHTTESPQSFILIGYRAEFAVFEIRSGALAVNKLGNTINYTIPQGSTNTISVYTNSNYTKCDIYSMSPFTVTKTL